MNNLAFPASGVSRAALLATSIGLIVASHAADRIKQNNALNLNDPGSWDTPPGVSDVGLWGATVTGANTVALGADLSWDGIKVASPGGLVTINAGNTLTLGTAGIDMSAATANLTMANPVTLGTAQSWNVGTGRTLAANGAIGGAGTLTKSGPGTLTLSATNTFNNGATISDGTIIAGNASAFGTGTLTLSGGTITTSGVHTFANPVFVVADTVTNIYGYNGGANYPRFTGPITGSGTIQNKPLQGGLGNAFINGDISGFTGTFNIESGPAEGDNFQFAGTTAASWDGSQAHFVVNGTGSGGNFIVIETDGMTFKMGDLSGTGGRITSVTNGTIEIGALNTDTAFSGIIEPIAGTISLGKVGTGRQTLAGTGIKHAGTTTISNGTLALSKTTAWVSNVVFGASNSPTLQLNSPLVADSWTFNRQITGGSAAAKIEKTGAGTVILTPAGSSSFNGSSTGALTASEGKLYQNNSNFSTAPAVSVGNGATFGGMGTVGAIKVNNGGILEGGYTGVGTLSGGNVTVGSLNTDTAIFKGTLSTTAGYKPMAVSGLTVNGGNQSVLLDASGVGLVNGTAYDVLVSASPISAPNASNVLAAFKSNSRTYTPFIDGTGTKVQLIYDQNASVYWVGTSGGAWNTSATQNWKLTGNNAFTTYQSNDTVLFHNSPVNPSVNIDTANVSPSSTVFDNTTTTAYTLASTGDFGIATGTITKNNNGLLTIENHNSTTGTVGLNGGNVVIWWEDSLGSGPIIFGGGKLTTEAAESTWPRNITVNGGGGTIDMTPVSGTLTHTGTLGGTGTLTKEGVGTLELAQTSGTATASLHIADGTLKLNCGTGAVTYSGNFTGNSGVLRLDGTGATRDTGLTFTGNNTFSGETHIYGRRIFLDSATPNGGMGGNIIVKNGNWPYHGLTIKANEQIADTAVLRFEQTNDAYDFRLNGKTETLAGIESLGAGQQGGGTFCIIENAGHDGGNDTGIGAGQLIVSGSGTYNYYGALRNENGGGNGVLNFTKAGTGTQLLYGTEIRYTGATTINGGDLILDAATNFGSSGVTVNGGSLTVNNTTGTGTGTCPAVTIKTNGTLAGAGSVGGTATIEAGGSVAPGTTTSAGTLTAATASLAGNYVCQLDGASGDRLNVTGTLTIVAGATITISELSAPTAPVYTILSYGALGGEPLPTIIPPSGYTVDTTSTVGQVKLVSGGAYDTWASANIPNENDRDKLDDPDNDGLANVLEFVTNGNPMSGTLTNLPTITNSGANVIFTFTRRDDAESLNPTVEFNNDLGVTWTTAVHNQGGVSIVTTPNGTDPDTVQVTIPKGVNSKLFARLKVVTP